MAKRRRDKGSGSISQLDNGTYRGYVTVGRNKNGKPKRRYVTAKTKREVNEKLNKILYQVASHTFRDTDSDLTLLAYLEQWLNAKEQEVKFRTIDAYCYNLKKYLEPRLSRVKLAKISPLEIQTALAEIAKQHGARTSNYCRAMLFAALRQAVGWKLIPHNPIESVIRVREEKREMTLWSPAQTKTVLEQARKERLYPLFYLALVTGLRIGELLGLQWQDIKGDVLTVKRTLTTKGAQHFFSTPKTERGYRIVILPEDAVKLLEEHRLKQDQERAYLGNSWTVTGHVFVDELGRLLKQRGVLYVWHNIQEDAGVPRARLHDTRHMHISLLVKSGVDPSAIADRVGHADPAFTLKQYSHVFDEQRRAAALSLDDLLKESKKDPKEK